MYIYIHEIPYPSHYDVFRSVLYFACFLVKSPPVFSQYANSLSPLRFTGSKA